MRAILIVTLTCVAGVGTAGAQGMMHENHASTGVASIQPLYQRVKDLFIRSAEQLPESLLAYKPTPAVRSFGQLLGHVANENFDFCAAALGEDNPNKADFEKTASKAELSKGLAASFTYCDRAYAISESKAMEETTLFGQEGSKLWALVFNVSHDSEHYGNIVTYMRLNGMVPPSSQGGM